MVLYLMEPTLLEWESLYHKIPKNSDTPKFAVITLKIEQDGFSLE